MKLVADIGGTNSRFAIVGDRPDDLSQINIFKNDDYTDFDSVFRDAIAAIEGKVSSVVIAVAGPLEDGNVELTNRGWPIVPSKLVAHCPGATVKLINDFAAQALCLPHLSQGGLQTIFAGEQQKGHKLVLGPGTGLGVGYLLNTGSGWMAAPGEGGHVGLPVQNQRELSLLEPLRNVWSKVDGAPFGRVSSERVLCGPGLVALYKALCLLEGLPLPGDEFDPKHVLEAYRNTDPLALEAVQLFTSFLGRVAGDLALALIPHGGIYVGGGLAPAIFEIAGTDLFLTELQAKGRVATVIDEVPVHIIHEPYAGLIGAGASN